MEITRKPQGAWLEAQVKGRLDSYWASHFKTSLDEMVREGGHQIRLNLAEVSYLSSAGIGAIIACHKQLAAIKGKLVLVNPSAAVKEVLVLSKLHTLLTFAEEGEEEARGRQAPTGRYFERNEVMFGVFDLERGARLACRLIGNPELLHCCRFTAGDCRKVRFPARALGVGLGALGQDFADCQGRFGEFLAAAGAAAYLPSDGTNVPDYMVAAGESIPELLVCYGLVCEGAFARHVRFEANEDVQRVGLTSIVGGLLEMADADRVGFVLLGETAGLMGAALKRSPALGERDGPEDLIAKDKLREVKLWRPALGEGAPFGYPRVRDWLSFTPERAYPHSLALVAGVAARGQQGPLDPFIRPLNPPTSPSMQGGDTGGVLGHCHAAAFTYRPLPKGELDLPATVGGLFEGQTLQGILHLLADNRPTVGLGESLFLRGACWFGPIGEVAAEAS